MKHTNQKLPDCVSVGVKNRVAAVDRQIWELWRTEQGKPPVLSARYSTRRECEAGKKVIAKFWRKCQFEIKYAGANIYACEDK